MTPRVKPEGGWCTCKPSGIEGPDPGCPMHGEVPVPPDFSGKDVKNSGWSPDHSAFVVEADQFAPWTTQGMIPIPAAMIAGMLRALGGTFSLTFTDFASYDGSTVHTQRVVDREVVMLILQEADSPGVAFISNQVLPLKSPPRFEPLKEEDPGDASPV
jgi:hypothetical protein